MSYYQVGPNDDDDAVRIRDVYVPPLRRRSSSIRRICPYDDYPSDQVITVVGPKKKKKKKKKCGLFSWLGGDDGCIISTKRVVEPSQMVYVDDRPWYRPPTHHHHHRHHPSYHHHDHYHRDRTYNQWGDRYQDHFDHHHGDHIQQFNSRRSRRGRNYYWDPPWPLTDREMRRRGERYKNSTECEWREELINLLAEQREEMAWERHHLDVMPEFEKINFMYRDTQMRNDRIAELTDLLEQAKEANLDRDLGRGLG